jgi:hypothetical protein
MRAILHICCQMQPGYCRLRYLSIGPSQIQYNYSTSYAGFNILFYVTPLLLVMYRVIDQRYTTHLLPNTVHHIRFTLCQLWSSQIQYNYYSSYSDINIQLKVSPMRLVVYPQINACYNPQLLPNKGHNIRITVCQIWSR